MKAARPIVSQRSPDAALGRETRNLIGQARGGGSGYARRDASRGGRHGLPGVSGLPSVAGLAGLLGRGRRGTASVGQRRRGIGRLVTPARAAGLLAMLAAGFLLTFVSGPSAFALSRTDITALRWTPERDVRAALALPSGVNVFRLDTAPIEAALEALPAVAEASVTVSLPDAALVVTIREREAILAWEAGDTRFLADREGVIFATVDRDAELPAEVAVVEDRRSHAADGLAVGARLDPVDLDVATRLASLKPADVGSAAPALHVRVTNGDGFAVYVEKGWQAVFGFYSPATRPASIIPGQVRSLRSLLFGREGSVARVVLASETGGTYVPKDTPRPSRK